MKQKVEHNHRTGEIKITFYNGKTIMISEPHPDHDFDFQIRTLNDAFWIKQSGAVNTLHIKMVRLGEGL